MVDLFEKFGLTVRDMNKRLLSMIGGAAAVALMGCSALVVSANNKTQDRAYAWTTHTLQVMMKAHELALSVSDTERSANATVEQGHPAAIFYKHSMAARVDLHELIVMTPDNKPQQFRWKLVEGLIDEQQAQYNIAIKAVTPKARREALHRGSIPQAKAINSITEAIRGENELLANRQDRFKAASSAMGTSIIAISGIALLLIFIAVRGTILGARAEQLAQEARARDEEIQERILIEDQLREAADRQKLLLDELNHRVKNSLATVQSIATQTKNAAIQQLGLDMQPVRKENLNRYFAAFEARLMSLSATHDLLVKGSWSGVSLQEAIEAALRPLIAPERSSFFGPQICLSPNAAVTLNMIFHELSTNAIKYGSMSNKTGAVDVRWDLNGTNLTICWKEKGGPVPIPPKSNGFGTKLIERGIGRELRGSHSLTFPQDGFCCTLVLPLSDHVSIPDK